jgi:5-methylcytosine-specific restriction endonuclease McrA
MTSEEMLVWSMSSAELLASARALVRRSHDVEADLLVHLAEIDDRRLYLECPFPSMFAFCVGELSFSEDAAYNRIMVARAGRRFPLIIEAIREGRVHLWGMRLLVPHLTEANHRELIAQAFGKTKRDIEERIAALAPRAPVASTVRSVPPQVATNGSALAEHAHDPGLPWTSNGFDPDGANAGQNDAPSSLAQPPFAMPPPRNGQVVPLAMQSYKVQFTAGRAFRVKLSEAEDLMRHRVPDGDLETIFAAALDLLIEQVKKEKFAVGRKAKPHDAGEPAAPTPPTPPPARPAATSSPAEGSVAPAAPKASAAPEPSAAPEAQAAPEQSGVSFAPSAVIEQAHPAVEQPHETPAHAAQTSKPASRHIPDAIKRAVYERDGGRCTYEDDRGRRCPATGALEFDHEGGFDGHHEVEKIRLLCRAHNQREAEKMFGRPFMESARKGRRAPATRSGTSRPRKAKP